MLLVGARMPEAGSDDEILALTQAACRGDRTALDALVVRFLPELRAFVRLRAGPEVREWESRSDLVQSVCREILDHAKRFKHPDQKAFKQWLFVTALRKIQERGRVVFAQKRDIGRQVRPQDAPTGRSGADVELLKCYSSISAPSRVAELHERIEQVERAFDQLSDEQREIVTLAHLVGLSRAEIAGRLGKSEGSVRVMLHRALARIAEIVEGGDVTPAADARSGT